MNPQGKGRVSGSGWTIHLIWPSHWGKKKVASFFCHFCCTTYHTLSGSAPAVQILRVITGCGTHGVGKSKLKQSVGFWLFDLDMLFKCIMS